MSFTKEEYLEEKRRYIAACANREFPALSQIAALRELGGDLAAEDFDLLVLEMDIKTRHFTKLTSKKKALKMLAELKCREPNHKSVYAQESLRAMMQYVSTCERRGKRRKIASIACCSFGVLLISGGLAGLWYADQAGILYGVGTISFTADGQTYLQNVMKYNEYVTLQLPAKAGYDILGVQDTYTGKLLFDSEGVSTEKVQQRDLTDYRNCNLEVVYEPHIYFASVCSSTGAADVVVSFTVEDRAEDIIAAPQQLDGYVFDGWYTDANFRHPFSGEFIDYIDEPLVLYPHYSLESWKVTWDLQGGEMLAESPDSYTILTDIALPNGNTVKKRGYDFVGWAVNGSLIEYFPSTSMEDLTLVAVWASKEFMVTIYPDNGKAVFTETVTYDAYYSISMPLYPGYEFSHLTFGEEIFPAVSVYQYDVDAVLIAHYVPKSYQISYVSEGSTIYSQTVVYGQPYSLYIPENRKNYEFAGWFDCAYGGSLVTDGVFLNDGNIALYASWRKVLTLELESGKDYAVDKTIEKAYIIGDYSGSSDTVMTDICIRVSARDTDLTIHLINVGFRAKDNCTAIECENSSYTLTVLLTGDSYIEGGRGSDGQDGKGGSEMSKSNCNGSDGFDGGHALDGGTVIFEDAAENASLTLRGGSGGRGGDGGIDKDRSRMWLNYVPDGGNGGNSAAALYCVEYSINGTTVNFEKGIAGEAGDAGSRGTWWRARNYGKDGEAGVQNDAVWKK